MRSVIDFIKSRTLSGHEQSVELKKNIVYAIGVKILALIVGLVYMPTVLSYVDKSLLGIVLTIDSIIHWLVITDMGIGMGLRNKFAGAVGLNQKEYARRLVSTAYFTFGALIIIIGIIGLGVSHFLDWNKILKLDHNSNELSLTVNFIFITFLITFWLKTINTLVNAHQRSYLNSFVELISKVSKLIVLMLAIRFTVPSLFRFAVIDHTLPILVLIVFSLLMFTTLLRDYRPSPSCFSRNEIRSITNLGFKFFWIQIAALILYATDNLIIARLFDVSEVTTYNIARHYYNQAYTIFTFVSIPLWSAYAKAFARQDYEWIKRITKKILTISATLCVLIMFMFMVSKPVIHFWLRGKVSVPTLLSLIMAMSIGTMLLTNPFVSFINGSGKIKLSLMLSPIIVVLNIPMSIFFAKYAGMGIAGVIFATLLCNIASLILSSIQYYKIVYRHSEGIWNK